MTTDELARAWRRKGVGASEIAAVCGFSKWGGPHSVWRDKTGRGEPIEESEAMSLGHELEELIVRRALAKLGLTAKSIEYQVCIERRDLAPW